VLFCPRAPLNICLFNTSYTILYIVEEVRERESREEDDPLPPPEIPLSRLLSGEMEVGECCAGIFKQSMGARNRVGIGLSYRPAKLQYIGWRNWFLEIDSWAP
jgi:hypothetical protein